MTINETTAAHDRPDGQIGPLLPLLLVEIHRCPPTCPAWNAPREDHADHGDECQDPVARLFTDDREAAHTFASAETRRYRRMHAGTYLVDRWTGEGVMRLRSYEEGRLIDRWGED